MTIQWPSRLFVRRTKPNPKGEQEKEEQKFQHAPKSAAQVVVVVVVLRVLELIHVIGLQSLNFITFLENTPGTRPTWERAMSRGQDLETKQVLRF